MKMKSVFFASVFMVASVSTAQELPAVVKQAFDKEFPGQVISSHSDNSSYDYESDMADDIYYNDYNYDGYSDGIYPYGGYGAGYGTGYGGGYGLGYGGGYGGYGLGYGGGYGYGYPNEYDVPVDYEATYTPPTNYQVYFTMDDIKMSALFKADGTFIIAKGRARSIPTKVAMTIQSKFKGQTIRFGNREEKIFVPSDKAAIYRVKVEVKHGKNHIMKVDETGKIISDRVV